MNAHKYNEFFDGRSGGNPADLMNQPSAGDDDEMKSIDLSQPSEVIKDSK